MERHGFLRVYFNIILINLEMESSLAAVVFRVKVDNELGGIQISHKEAIFTWRDK